jgi:hypothetical protein
MASRDELKALIDQLPEETLDQARLNLAHFLAPRKPRPEAQQQTERRMTNWKALREQLISEQHIAETRELGATGGRSGGGGGRGMTGMHEGVPFGRYGFQFWDKKALIHRALLSYDGQELEIMERLSFSPDGAKLICSLEIASGGHTVRHEDEFPLAQAEARP